MKEQTILAFPSPAAIPTPEFNQAATDLSAMAVEHALWLDSEGREGKRASRRGIDLTGAKLASLRLMEANFRGAILTGADLRGADLRGADLAEANLDGADMSGALLSGASLARARLHGTNGAGADLATANLTGAIAEGIILTDAKMNGAILRDANFRRADLSRAVLRDANLRGATAVEANLSGADISSADCRDVNFDRARFAEATLAGANFRGASLGDVDIKASNFSGALDVAAEVAQHAGEMEHAKLQQEQARIAAIEASLDLRAKAIDAQQARFKEQMESVNAFQAELVKRTEWLASSSKGFVGFAVLWLVFAGTILALIVNTATQLQHMKTERVVFVVGIALFAILLAFFSMLRSLKVAYLLRSAAAVSFDSEAPKSGGKSSRAEASLSGIKQKAGAKKSRWFWEAKINLRFSGQ